MRQFCKLQSNLNVIIAVLVKIMKVSIHYAPLISLQKKDMMVMSWSCHKEFHPGELPQMGQLPPKAQGAAW